MNCRTLLSILFLGSFSVACSKAPVLYDNDTYKASPGKADQAVSDCTAKAETAKAQGSGPFADALYDGVAGGAASAAAGGAAAAIGGGNYDVGKSMEMSAGAGFAGNFILSMFYQDVDPIFARYVEKCLTDKGYQPIGWR